MIGPAFFPRGARPPPRHTTPRAPFGASPAITPCAATEPNSLKFSPANAYIESGLSMPRPGCQSEPRIGENGTEMTHPARIWAAAAAVACLMATPAGLSSDESDRAPYPKDKESILRKAIIIDGSALHSAGNLQMNVTNFGFLGSMPGSNYTMADFPSAQWPAGSGVEYLYAGGIWIGAQMDWVESVSTGFPETEFYPGEGPEDIIYRSYEGAPNGTHYPGAADDDGDRRVDEDWLNGVDDDEDGRIDEDYAAFGKLMYSCRYRDDQDKSRGAWPEHTPLHVEVRQETYQWGDEEFKDFIAVHYGVSNKGDRYLTNVYVGLYADLDAGPRDRGNYFKDDFIGTWSGIWCAPPSGFEQPVRLSLVYVYDNDGDEGQTKGYFGILFLGGTSRIQFAQGQTLEGALYNYAYIENPSVQGVRIFAGLLPYAHGGEPVNDTERYASLSKAGTDPSPKTMNDYRVLMSVGPFGVIPPDSAISVDFAYVAGEGLEDLLDNAAAAALLYNGMWINADGRQLTGQSGRETPLPGPLKDFVPDLCSWNETTLFQAAKQETLWSNLDCEDEYWMYSYNGCHRPYASLSSFLTGNLGKETHVRWVTSSSPPPPSMRLVAGDGKVTIHWDNRSEIVPDAVTMKNDFEGYEIWRADDWHRPIGTTTTSGPSSDLWHLIARRDLVNGLLPDDDFKKPPAYGGFQYKPLAQFPDRDRYIKAFEEGLRYMPADTAPCPPGITSEVCDTLEALARWNLGLEGGRQYYQFIDSKAKNGLPYFYSVVAWDHTFDSQGRVSEAGRYDSPYSNFQYVVPLSSAQEAAAFRESRVYVVPNPVTAQQMQPWLLGPTNADPTGEKIEFRNLPRCMNTVRIYTVAGDLVQTLTHDGTSGNGTLPWNLVSRNGQSITSGIYLYSVEPQDPRLSRFVGKFVVIR